MVIVGRRGVALLDHDVGALQSGFGIATAAVGGRVARHLRRECLPEPLAKRGDGGRHFISTSTEAAARRACPGVSATTTATGCPAKWTTGS